MTEKLAGRHPCSIFPTMSLNDNFNFLGRELHVQTENVLSGTRCIRTHVFSGGHIIHTTKLALSSSMTDPLDFDRIRDMMHAQHRKVLEKISRQQSKYTNNSNS